MDADETARRIGRLEVLIDQANAERRDIARALAAIEEGVKYRANLDDRMIEDSETIHRDHETRLRSLERVAWALAGTAGASMVTAIISFVSAKGHP
jgi:hypothetical protein